jgi:serine-type D-Ala-D-Ala endopeptidase (penicillin-binding protein 7)
MTARVGMMCETMRRRPFLAIAVMLLTFCMGLSPAEARRGKKRKAPKRELKVAALTKDGRPNVQAKGALILDLDTGEELYGREADTPRRIASVGKLFLALAVRRKGIDLSKTTEIQDIDYHYARRGARSRLPKGKSFQNHDLLRAMLISSDNRACTALGRAAGLTPEQLVAAMNDEARRLGLTKTIFTDPTGLNGNESTPRETARALKAALADPVIAAVLAQPYAVVKSTDNQVLVEYVTTNLPLRAGREGILGGKTGYTDAARYCLAIAAKLGGRRIGMVFLGAEGELTRFADFRRGSDWYLARHTAKATAKN